MKYCKNCGRELKDGARFCDRCGHSVRKGSQSEQSQRRETARDLKEERLNRKKLINEKEEKRNQIQKKKKNRKKKKTNVIMFVIVMFLIAIVSAIVSYQLFSEKTEDAPWRNQDGVISLEQPSTPAPTQNVVLSTKQPVSQTDVPAVNSNMPKPEATDNESKNNVNDIDENKANSDGYKVYKINDVSCPYPATFQNKNASGEVKLNLIDVKGGGTMKITQKAGATDTGSDLLKAAARELGGSLEYTRAGDNWYVITTEKNGIVYHRKCIVTDKTAIYYDFQYDIGSSAADQYTKYIEYIDANFNA